MVLLELNELNITKSNTGNYDIEIIFFKNRLINLFLISNTLDGKISENIDNELNLRYIFFGEEGIGLQTKTIETGAVLENVTGIICQKSKKYENYKSGFVAYNIVSYYLNSIWKSENYFRLGYNYNFSHKHSSFIGVTNKTEEYIEYRPKVELSDVYRKRNVDINNLLYFPIKDIIIGFKNNFDINAFSYIPLLKPMPIVKVSSKNLDSTSSQLLSFENDIFFNTNSISLNDEIQEVYVKVRPLRITREDLKEDNVDKFENVLFKYESDNKYYNVEYEEYINYKLKVNIISIRFINNFSSQQINNKILINRFTNNTIESIYLNERENNSNYNKVYNWENELPLITKDSYMKFKIAGIKEDRLREITNNAEIKFKVLVINKTESVLDIYIHIPSSKHIKINKNTDNYDEIILTNDVIELIPKAKENTNGQSGLVGIKILESNSSLFENLIIDDITVKIAGVQSNFNKILINLNRPYAGDDDYNSSLNYLTNQVIYSNILKISAINDNFFNRLDIVDNLEFINDDGDPDIMAGKNPKIINLEQVVTRIYKLIIFESDDNINFRIQRDTYDDKSLSEFTDETSLLSYLNPDIEGTEAEKLYFDLSDISCFKKTIKFYVDSECKNELLYRNSTFLPHARYSRNKVPGEAGAYVELDIPYDNTRSLLGLSNSDPKIYFKIDTTNQKQKTVKVCQIKIKTLKRLHHGEISVTTVLPNDSESGVLEYDNDNFYDPLEVKPRIDLSLNLIDNNIYTYFTYNDNIFNNVSFVDVDDSFFGVDCSNTNVFIGDNMIMSENTFNKYGFAFYLRNSNIIYGTMRIGISNANKNGVFNTDLFEIKSGNLSLLQYPNNDHVGNTEKKISYNSTLNNTKYNIYLTSKFVGFSRPKLVKYLIKYSNNGEYNTDNFIESQGIINSSILNDNYQGSTLEDIYLIGYIKNQQLLLCLVVLKENDHNIITVFNKIMSSEMITTNTSLFNTSANIILNKYKNSLEVSTNSGDIANKLYYNSDNNNLKLAYVRKKFNFIPKVNCNNKTIENEDIILFQPISVYYNKINHTQMQNHYLIAFFDTENNKEYIKFFKIILQKEEPFFYNLGNSTNGRIVNNPEMSDIWYPGTKFGLFLTKPSNLINIYNQRENFAFLINSDDDTVINTPDDFTVLRDFVLPLLDSNKYSDISIEIKYLRRYYDDSRVEIKMFRKNADDINNPIQINGTVVIKQSEFESYYNNLSRNDIFFDIDVSGQVILNLPGDFNLGSGNFTVETPYIITYQVANHNDNTVFLKKLTESKKFFNFTNLTEGGINTYQKKQKTVLNVKKFTTPLRLNDNETDISKNEFNDFLDRNNLNIRINKQSKMITNRIKNQDRFVDLDALTKTGTGRIRYYTQEINQSLNVDIS